MSFSSRRLDLVAVPHRVVWNRTVSQAIGGRDRYSTHQSLTASARIAGVSSIFGCTSVPSTRRWLQAQAWHFVVLTDAENRARLGAVRARVRSADATARAALNQPIPTRPSGEQQELVHAAIVGNRARATSPLGPLPPRGPLLRRLRSGRRGWLRRGCLVGRPPAVLRVALLMPTLRSGLFVAGFAVLLRVPSRASVVLPLVAPLHASRLSINRDGTSKRHECRQDTNTSQKTHHSLHAVLLSCGDL